MRQDVYGPIAVSVRVAQNWFKHFRSDNFDIKDEPRSGRPVKDKVKQDQLSENSGDPLHSSHFINPIPEPVFHIIPFQTFYNALVTSLGLIASIDCSDNLLPDGSSSHFPLDFTAKKNVTLQNCELPKAELTTWLSRGPPLATEGLGSYVVKTYIRKPIGHWTGLDVV
ncbi:hypothetical protein EVAR_58451_1 [Eumeta japonica]|uniref:Mos1 transposase HTH domain-containing protein n=1 Tax=Eumeta variegata TaxID=151549 RepID=A0A4C1Z791_EUMVA|nr:hypothetical protein EVAR_58451_1 [Eumeta japonica]